jgi:hypothetical protein
MHDQFCVILEFRTTETPVNACQCIYISNLEQRKMLINLFFFKKKKKKEKEKKNFFHSFFLNNTFLLFNMSSTTSTNNGAMHSNRRSNPCINWIEEAIAKRHIKYYEYKNFSNIKEISTGTYGKISRANWKNSNKYLSLKSFFVRENSTIKEIIHEVIL